MRKKIIKKCADNMLPELREGHSQNDAFNIEIYFPMLDVQMLDNLISALLLFYPVLRAQS